MLLVTTFRHHGLGLEGGFAAPFLGGRAKLLVTVTAFRECSLELKEAVAAPFLRGRA